MSEHYSLVVLRYPDDGGGISDTTSAASLRYVDSPEAWRDEVLASAMAELRRGREPIVSVKAARLKREQADALLAFVDDLNDDVADLSSTLRLILGLLSQRRWWNQNVAGAEQVAKDVLLGGYAPEDDRG